MAVASLAFGKPDSLSSVIQGKGSVMQGFPRAARMLCPEEFGAALKTKPVAKGSLLVLHHKQDQESLHARLGLIVPKRLLKKAVSRNALKRTVREAFRTHRNTLAPGLYAFRLHSSPQATSLTALKKRIRHECDRLLNRIPGQQ